MLTDTDREAAARVFDEIARTASHPEAATFYRHYAKKVRAGDGDDFDVVRAAYNARTASTAALTAEIQRCLNQMPPPASIADGAYLDGWAEGQQYLIDNISAALSTPSEVSEPVADESGGDVAEISELLRKHDAGDYYRATPPNPTNGAHPSLELCVHFSDDGKHIRKWSRLPFDGGECLYSHPTNGDAVREALEEALRYITQRDSNRFFAERKVREAVAALNHGGAQG